MRKDDDVKQGKKPGRKVEARNLLVEQ